MNFLRKIINQTYPLRTWFSKVTGLGIEVYENKNKEPASESFYSLKAILNSGKEISFEKFRGKKVLLVNVASECGFTPQYAELEKLYQQDEVIVLGFPSNNFGSQEPLNDEKIANFCKVNFGVTFPVFKKNDVTGFEKQPVYKWLTDPGKNGWNNEEPKWNFYKYLVDENGNLEKIFSSSVSPLDKKFIK
jgi:glutathione peroxidase